MDIGIKSQYRESDNTWHIAVDGEIDIYNSEQFKDAIQKLTDQIQANLLFDCSKLTYIDSTGLGALVSLLKRAKQHQCSIRLIHVKANIIKLFKITDLDKIFLVEGGEYEENGKPN